MSEVRSNLNSIGVTPQSECLRIGNRGLWRQRGSEFVPRLYGIVLRDSIAKAPEFLVPSVIDVEATIYPARTRQCEIESLRTVRRHEKHSILTGPDAIREGH